MRTDFLRRYFPEIRKIILFYVFLIISTPVFAWEEAWIPEKVSIGENAEYSLVFKKGEIVLSEPLSKGIHPDPNSPDLPLLEILSYESSEDSLKIRAAYYAPGKFSLPISWKDASGREFRSEKVLTVLSSLGEKDSSPEDILPPLEFSGPYFWKLAAWISAFLALGLAAFYAWYLHRTRSKEPVDALVEANPWIQKILIYENRLDELLQVSPIGARDFYRALSGYIRESLAQKMLSSFAHLTEAELFSKIYESFPIDGEEVKNWENLLRKSQYSGNEAELSREEAVEAWDYWKGVLGP
ncbi:LB_053 family protein [Leptospira wolffii]|uniref:LB_053 family protein n=1 Tax=Leptospira wolffii TaxID=409998 RepID=A0ABV5BP64_9LEPT|nr:hypothetical protein [Leptospira wolffii]TGL47502.1 hypothetical protein EHQ61_15455 [Leptospira wolffii]